MLHRLIVLITLLFFLAADVTFAHSGGTDSEGGHWDHQNKEYHYHKDGKIIQDKGRKYEERSRSDKDDNERVT